ncbi:MAG: hypothetical protein EOO00_13355 [Chitinophagaceae bacterium]|nr:MAG: hypothetical protein EOO00_13355 [Chitinophagaceae bacterium]
MELLYTNSNGWKLYRYTVAGGAQVTVSGSGLIDELRLHPVDALMSTVCYREGIGKTDECDANGRIIYYEYDSFGRLKIIRDQERNILKAYEYNYKSN